MIKYYLIFPALFITSIVCGQNLPKTILWEVAKDGNMHKSYLFGTFHEVDPAFFEALPNTMSKLKQADVLFVERKQNASNTVTENDRSFWTIDKWKVLLDKRQDSIFKAFTTKAGSNNYYHLPPLRLSMEIVREYLQFTCDREGRTSFEIMDDFIESIATKQEKKIFSLDKNHGAMINDAQNSFNYSLDSLYASVSIEYMENMLNENQSGCATLIEYKNFNLNYELDTDIKQGANYDALLTERNKKWQQLLTKHFCKIIVLLP